LRCRCVWSTADLVILVPMLGRAHRVEPLLESIHETTPTARVLFLVSPEDYDVHDAINHAGKERLTVPWRPGDYARKVNEGYRATTEPLIFTGACDLRFHPGWFEACLAKLDDHIGVVGTQDLCNRRTRTRRHSTHSLVTRWYADLGTIDQPRTIYHEGYPHEWVDDELCETAKRRGAYAHAMDAIVEHLHPMNGGAPVDELYAAQGERITAGRPLFEERRRLWSQ
jgi:hypothetical protein